MNLNDKKCTPREEESSSLKGEELNFYLGKVNNWQLYKEKKIRKEFKFPDFKKALFFVNKVGDISETENHHPEIHLSWGRVVVEIWTHTISGLSENDFILAAKIDKILE